MKLEVPEVSMLDWKLTGLEMKAVEGSILDPRRPRVESLGLIGEEEEVGTWKRERETRVR